MRNAEKEPRSGLWAFEHGHFYALVLEPGDRKTDHVKWFGELGLPDYGPAYDHIMRGRMTWDWHCQHFVLSYYGMDQLPNLVYELVVAHFNSEGAMVVEKPMPCYWA